MRIRKSADERKSEIVEAAVELADRVGPDRLTTEAIAKAVGLTQPAVFRHFSTKQEIWIAVAGWIGEKLQSRWSAEENRGASSTDTVRGVSIAQLTFIRSTPAVPAILFSRELHQENESLRKMFFALMGGLHRLLTRLVEEGQRNGELRPDVVPDDVAFLVIGLIQGLAVRWSLSGRSFDLVAEGERLLDLQLRGFIADSPETNGDVHE